jgi:hypothetical protein
MTEFENVLQDCLLSLERGDSNIEECLRRYPNHAVQLAPVLLTSLDLERGTAARPSAAFKARVRGKLIEEMRTHPRRSVRFTFVWTRMATNLAIILLALLVAGTVYAQGVLPGNPFHEWKLVSENIWRMISPDPIATDLVIAERRAGELLAVRNSPELGTQALEEYLEVVNRLELEMNADNEARIQSVLEAQIKELNRSGIVLPELNETILPSVEEPTVFPTETPQVIPEIPQVDPTLPVPTFNSDIVSEPTQSSSNVLPTIVPAVNSVTVPKPTQANSSVLPTVIPTIHVPPLLP